MALKPSLWIAKLSIVHLSPAVLIRCDLLMFSYEEIAAQIRNMCIRRCMIYSHTCITPLILLTFLLFIWHRFGDVRSKAMEETSKKIKLETKCSGKEINCWCVRSKTPKAFIFILWMLFYKCKFIFKAGGFLGKWEE